MMQQKDDYTLRIEEYTCLNYKSNIECKTCNGFGKNTNEGTNGKVRECYISKMKMKADLNLTNKFY